VLNYWELGYFKKGLNLESKRFSRVRSSSELARKEIISKSSIEVSKNACDYRVASLFKVSMLCRDIIDISSH
jgi:hypothetical protein